MLRTASTHRGLEIGFSTPQSLLLWNVHWAVLPRMAHWPLGHWQGWAVVGHAEATSIFHSSFTRQSSSTEWSIWRSAAGPALGLPRVEGGFQESCGPGRRGLSRCPISGLKILWERRKGFAHFLHSSSQQIRSGIILEACPGHDRCEEDGHSLSSQEIPLDGNSFMVSGKGKVQRPRCGGRGLGVCPQLTGFVREKADRATAWALLETAGGERTPSALVVLAG